MLRAWVDSAISSKNAAIAHKPKAVLMPFLEPILTAMVPARQQAIDEDTDDTIAFTKILPGTYFK
eukprot:CAMPEP_0170454358 /NCGR_PEP_ID=MMETSP0123-20130129/2638_1 /TAXON_ID=182087 /ORGANISM="Favella ehrenbergii, Strain Fehren 1" /LENGTH=64 /DNA_ID=CAMNT_0010717047 /DNA_START=925 /DNA_END=1119 /DNA_ORIENTATION=-